MNQNESTADAPVLPPALNSSLGPSAFSFTVPGKPMGQPRPRFARIGAHVRTYDSKEAVSYKGLIAMCAQAAGVRPIDGPVSVTIHAFFPRPQRLCRRKDDPAPCWDPAKPDADNIAKGVMDALNGIAYADDKAVVCATVSKKYHELGGVPRVEVTIKELT